jgi:prepilin-type N-terminal cleavage/methylation domain-containing protein
MELKRNKIRNTQYAIRDTRYAFTLVELLIVVAILGILAAMTLPMLKGHITEAKEAAAKDNLRVLRNAIGLYAARHGGIPPGYPYDNTSLPVLLTAFVLGVRGNYLNALPENPFNNKTTFLMIANGSSFPAAPTGQYGWVYQPQTKTIKLDWPGTDKDGVSYYDY